MTNREKYITKRNEYDLMMTICKNIAINACPIKIITGECSVPKYGLCQYGGWEGECEDCIQYWLNEESE